MTNGLRHEPLCSAAFLSIGFILLSSVAGCAMGPGYGAEPRQDSPRMGMQTKPSLEAAPLQGTGRQEKAIAPREATQRNVDPARVENARKPATEDSALTKRQPQHKDRKRLVTTQKPPNQTSPPPPTADSPLPPLPSKPPAIGGSGG